MRANRLRNDQESDPIIRRAASKDLEQLTGLMEAHARFEDSAFDRTVDRARWEQVLISGTGSIQRFVADHVFDDPAPSLVRYATCSPEFSTLTSREFLHKDTLFV
jgi:hypothetical protein